MVRTVMIALSTLLATFVYLPRCTAQNNPFGNSAPTQVAPPAAVQMPLRNRVPVDAMGLSPQVRSLLDAALDRADSAGTSGQPSVAAHPLASPGVVTTPGVSILPDKICINAGGVAFSVPRSRSAVSAVSASPNPTVAVPGTDGALHDARQWLLFSQGLRSLKSGRYDQAALHFRQGPTQQHNPSRPAFLMLCYLLEGDVPSAAAEGYEAASQGVLLDWPAMQSSLPDTERIRMRYRELQTASAQANADRNVVFLTGLLHYSLGHDQACRAVLKRLDTVLPNDPVVARLRKMMAERRLLQPPAPLDTPS